MKSINLIFGCHSHQPVGNFDFVFAEAYEKAYKPFIDVLERFPAVHVTLHYTGPLWDWFLEHAPDYIGRLKKLVEGGQVEIMGGGYYEPLLCAIPERDALAQIKRMQDFCEEHLGTRPKGMWLTERVWEPQMARTLARAGVAYTALDDAHFFASGLRREELFGYYMTEDEGEVLKVFPIQQQLRYQIPFHTVEETIDYLREHATEAGDRCAVVHDDGEKFGVWPYTYQSVYEEGWLERFFEALTENQDWIKSVTYGEYLAKAAPLGRTYITCASYKEMMAWALPSDMQRTLQEFEGRLQEEPEQYAEYSPFVRGGFWRGFLAKYAEANGIQKRMLRVSHRLHQLREQHNTSPALAQAEQFLHEGQCNCAYWHGVFGGLYLNHLRSALYEKLIAADIALDEAAGRTAPYRREEEGDFDADGMTEVLLENDSMALFFKPDDGGALYELDYKPRPFNLMNTLTRRDEAYHDRLREQVDAAPQDGVGAKSIHDLGTIKEVGLDQLLVADPYRRTSLREHFWADAPDVQALWSNQQPPLASFSQLPFRCKIRPGVVVMTAQSGVTNCPVGQITLTKRIELAADASRFSVSYDVAYEGPQPISATFGVEFALNFLAGNAPDRYYWSEDRFLGDPMLATRGCESGLRHFALRDRWLQLEWPMIFSDAADVYRYPIETVSQSEGGLERVYQGSIVTPTWRLELTPGKTLRRTLECAVVRISDS